MGLNNPDILFPMLEDLSQKVRDFNHRISYTVDDGERLKYVSSDQTSRATFDTHHTADIQVKDEDRVRYWNGEVTDLLSKTRNLVSSISATRNKLEQLLFACRKSLSYWDGQLAHARQKLLEWQAYFNKAVAGMNTAVIAEQSARARYNSAASSYHNCVNAKDSQGRPVNRNCSGYQYEMSAAQTAINQARQAYNYWLGEKNKAEAEIRRWEARIEKCNDSIGKLNNAVTLTNRELQVVSQAADYAQRCLEEINSAGTLVQRAKEKNEEQSGLVSQNQVNVRALQSLSDNASHAFMMADKLADQVQVYGSLAREEINRKVDLLKEFSIIPNL